MPVSVEAAGAIMVSVDVLVEVELDGIGRLGTGGGRQARGYGTAAGGRN